MLDTFKEMNKFKVETLDNGLLESLKEKNKKYSE